MFGPFGQNISSFVWISTLLFLPDFLSNLLQTLAQWSLCFGEVCYDFSKEHMIFRIYSGFSGSPCGSTSARWFTCREESMNESWLLNRGPLSKATRPTPWAPSTFNQLKYRGLYPIMFECGTSVAESFPASSQHWVLDMNSRAFQILHFNIELAVVIASNTKRQRNVVLMFCQRHRQWYSIKITKKAESRNRKLQSICRIFHKYRNIRFDSCAIAKHCKYLNVFFDLRAIFFFFTQVDLQNTIILA